MKTVFIVGAGASFDYGFPVGKGLQHEIVDFISRNKQTDSGFSSAIEYSLGHMKDLGHSYDEVIDTCEWIKKSLLLSPSIDSFLENQSVPGDLISYIGKLAIAQIIGTREASSNLAKFKEEYSRSQNLSTTWLGRAWNAMNSGGVSNKVASPMPDSSFITFNYDRCIEHFLYSAIELFYKTDKKDTNFLLESIPIVHVYGSLGDITTQDGKNSFGEFRHGYSFTEIAERIKTYSEQVESMVSDRISDIIDKSDRVIFLGFSFGKINRNFLNDLVEPKLSRKIFGSSFGMSTQDTLAASNWAHARFSNSSAVNYLTPCKADQFFEQNYMIF